MLDVRKREEEEQDQELEQEQQIPPELMQLAALLLQSFLSGDRESVEALYEMYHEPDKFVERQRNAVKEMLRELMADGKLTAEEAKQIAQQMGETQDSVAEQAQDDQQSAQTPNAEQANSKPAAIPEDQQRVINPKGKTLHEIMGITR